MTTFFYLDIGGKTPNKFIWKHVLFSFLWIAGISILLFRIDVVVFNQNSISVDWLEGTLPVILLILVGIVMVLQKWYYSLALIFYPVLAFGWFIPKAVLRKGKIYLFVKYINAIYRFFTRFKFVLIHISVFVLTVLLLMISSSYIVKVLAIVTMVYFYALYVFNYIKKSFQPAQLFGQNVETMIDASLLQCKKNESFLITTFVTRLEKDGVDKENKSLKRLIMINYAVERFADRLNGFRGKRAFLIALVYELIVFLFLSLFLFWFVNYQLFHVSHTNFQTVGTPGAFDFLYYTIKKITFGDIDYIKPISTIAKVFEILSFFVIGIFLLIIVISMFFALRNDKITENVKLTTTLCTEQNRVIKEYVVNAYGKDIQTALSEVQAIGDSLKKLKSIIDNIF
jgi:hypothetical protein